MSKRGMSIDDKRRAILSVYHELKEPLNLKEIEKAASSKGVVSQTIKDVNQSLIDDNLLQSDKIGAANFFWSFPSKAFIDKKVEKEKYEKMNKTISENLVNLENQVETAKEIRKDVNRADKLTDLHILKEKYNDLMMKIESNRANNPDEVNRIKKIADECLTGANRWVDNTFAAKKYLKKKCSITDSDANKLLKMNADFDYFTEESAPKISKKK